MLVSYSYRYSQRYVPERVVIPVFFCSLRHRDIVEFFVEIERREDLFLDRPSNAVGRFVAVGSCPAPFAGSGRYSSLPHSMSHRLSFSRSALVTASTRYLWPLQAVLLPGLSWSLPPGPLVPLDSISEPGGAANSHRWLSYRNSDRARSEPFQQFSRKCRLSHWPVCEFSVWFFTGVCSIAFASWFTVSAIMMCSDFCFPFSRLNTMMCSAMQISVCMNYPNLLINIKTVYVIVNVKDLYHKYTKVRRLIWKIRFVLWLDKWQTIVI